MARIDHQWLLLAGLGLVFGLGHVFDLSRAWFASFSPLAALLLTALILWDRFRALGRVALRVGLILWGLGFAAEVLSLHTGIPFGRYEYGPLLGPGVFGVPLSIGLAWLIVILGSHALAHRIVKTGSPRVVAILLTALAGLAFDRVMEPVAVALEYWRWDGGVVPSSNYLGWFAVAAVGAGLLERQGFRPSPTALRIWICGAAFFMLIRVALRDSP